MSDQDTRTEVLAHTRERPQASTITSPPSARKHQADRIAPDKHQPTGQSFQPLEPILSRSYGSSLPTSLTYIILSTRGCSPWRPNADIGTIECKLIASLGV
ncbi:hypothetical protein B9Z55_028876 [Caenorhabditis nigoni]|uniref:Uncharacterized protein n=1 Tax=Caenorhabditis nigoni TaxID=1611254 RepID=A0A2G5SA18_9PELO|nr:hypothetical protein B9Z55_028876 [Caenorhabditis nigoni]